MRLNFLWSWWWYFSSLARIFEECFTIHSPPTLFCFCIFVKVEISSRTLIPLFLLGSVHSGSANWDDCGRIIPDKLRVSSFPDRFQHYGCTAALSVLCTVTNTYLSLYCALRQASTCQYTVCCDKYASVTVLCAVTNICHYIVRCDKYAFLIGLRAMTKYASLAYCALWQIHNVCHYTVRCDKYCTRMSLDCALWQILYTHVTTLCALTSTYFRCTVCCNRQ